MRRSTAILAAGTGILVSVAIAAWIVMRGDPLRSFPSSGTDAGTDATPAPAEAARRTPARTPVAPPMPSVPDDDAGHNGIFAALGRATYRGRRWLPIAGIALVIGLNVWARVEGDALSQGGWQVDGSEAARANEL